MRTCLPLVHCPCPPPFPSAARSVCRAELSLDQEVDLAPRSHSTAADTVHNILDALRAERPGLLSCFRVVRQQTAEEVLVVRCMVEDRTVQMMSYEEFMVRRHPAACSVLGQRLTSRVPSLAAPLRENGRRKGGVTPGDPRQAPSPKRAGLRRKSTWSTSTTADVFWSSAELVCCSGPGVLLGVTPLE